MTDIQVVGRILDSLDLGKDLNEFLPESKGLKTRAVGSFTWRIDNWHELINDKYRSGRYKFDGLEWDLLIFPQGNHSRGVSIYIAPHPDPELISEDYNINDWHVCAQFAIVFSKPEDDAKVQLSNKASHRFTATDKDWGFSNFIELDYLKHYSRNKPSGLLNQGALNITVFVRTIEDSTGVLWHNFLNYDSKKMTGFVGFKNQGATCYLNSLLQSYHFTKLFRNLVYHIPTENENPTDSVALALQRAFYLLQTSNEPLDTTELTKSFGWDTGDAFTQHDVQELNRILMDRLEQRMKGTAVEGKINELFVGKMKSYIKCINVDYESSRVEDYWDIQLNVKDIKNLQQSFEQYIEVELMNGENQYAAQDHGLQDAQKGVVFESFPPVLHLQLKRFEYDFNYDQLIKINDRYEFPESIDLSPYLDSSVSKDTPAEYILHGVLVHSGDISTGHYYAMIQPDAHGSWYRFDDDRVIKATDTQVFEENFGKAKASDEEIQGFTKDDYQNYLLARQTSAYMLVYIRKDMEKSILKEVEQTDVPAHVVSSIDQELEVRQLRRKEMEDMHLYANVHLHTARNFIHTSAHDISPNKRAPEFSPELYTKKEYALEKRVLKSTKLKDLFASFTTDLHIKNPDLVQYWDMTYRLNDTLRVDEKIPDRFLELTIDELMKSKGRTTAFDFYLEEPYFELSYLAELERNESIKFTAMDDQFLSHIEDGVANKVLPSPAIKEDSNSSVMVLLKHFDVQTQTLSGFCHAKLDLWDKVSRITDLLSTLSPELNPDNIYEESNPSEVVQLSSSDELIKSEIKNGDILSFCTNTSNPTTKVPYYPDIPAYYNYLSSRIKLTFTRSADSDEDFVITNDEDRETFSFWLSSKSTYNELTKVISKHAKVKPEYLRLYAVYPSRKFVMNSNSVLTDYLIKNFTKETIPHFEYEVLSIELHQLEHLRSIKFIWLTDSYVHFQCSEFRVPNSSTVREFIEKLQARVGFSDEDKQNILLWTNSSFEFEGILTPNMIFESMKSSLVVFGRVLPEELNVIKQIEVDSGYDDEEIENSDSVNLDSSTLPKSGKIVIVNQYFRELENSHGISFLFVLFPEERFEETRARLHERFGLGRKEFSKIKLGAYFQSEKGATFMPLEDDASTNNLILYEKLNNLDHLCMDHPDRSRAQNTYSDRPMVIKN
ncbi:unnamed protein product [Kluyveromyces dobzhanskii CBS 2104]|uniref:ubiquitinyl hydrolase 1 n=1 Tax=Kluyveromyces dobzhanskii CBS 2104 TaxID=1427455 RepID=A0A0A8LBH0_9SACH|nr:unnamed protein product [Kluyveromyces dobzhanskii CBS 2104]